MKNKNKIPCKLVGYGNSMKTKSQHVFISDLDLGLYRKKYQKKAQNTDFLDHVHQKNFLNLCSK